MIKLKTTRKEVSYCYRPIAIGYCGAQYLLWGKSACAYTSGIYGWNFDVYELENATITTGYRGMVGKRPDYELLSKLEKKAEKVVYNPKLSYKQKINRLDKLLTVLVDSVYPL